MKGLLNIGLLWMALSAHAEQAMAPVQVQTNRDPFRVAFQRVSKGKITGLTIEDSQDSGGVKNFRSKAFQYLRFKKGELKPEQAGLAPEQCKEGSVLRNPFCDFQGEEWQMTLTREKYESDNPGEGAAVSRITLSERDKISAALQNTDLAELEDVREADVRRVLRKKNDFESLMKISSEVMDGRKCPPTAVLTALGSKIEEFFPEPKAVARVTDLYARADTCAEVQDPAVTRARYRLGLFYMMNGGCLKAEPVFKRLVDYKVDDGMVFRGLYWLGKCAKDSGNKLAVQVYQNRIIKWNPIAFHTIALADEGPLSPLKTFLLSSQPELMLRSRSKPELNTIVRAVEAILELPPTAYTREILSYLRTKSTTAEPEFQLYLAFLSDRADDVFGKFQLISRVFRLEPSLVSDETLRMFYPLEQIDSLRKYRNEIDPLLVASLIRQESAFNVRARSSVGAIGLMQLMPQTARQLGLAAKTKLYSPDTNIHFGIRYLQKLISRFEGEVDLALAAYNAGPERVVEWRRRYPTHDPILFVDLIPYAETRNYIALISRNYFWYRRLYPSVIIDPAPERTLAGSKRKKRK